MAETWQSLSSAKREANAAKIPKEWRLSESILNKYSPKADVGVLDVPRTCGILTEKEIELTEGYDASGLLALLAKGEVRYAKRLLVYYLVGS
jgi:amidase